LPKKFSKFFTLPIVVSVPIIAPGLKMPFSKIAVMVGPRFESKYASIIGPSAEETISFSKFSNSATNKIKSKMSLITFQF